MSDLICKKCHHKIREKDNFCSNCGALVKPREIRCANCGEKLRKNDHFCFNCGEPVDSDIDNYRLPVEQDDEQGNLVDSGKNEKDLYGIGGWLVLFMIFLLLSSVRMFLGIHIFSTDDCMALMNMGGDSDICMATQSYFNFTVSVSIFTGILLIATFYLMFKKRKAGVLLALLTFIGYSLMAIVSYIWLYSIIRFHGLPEDTVNRISGEELINMIAILVVLLIWSTYLVMSKRVKNTMVE